MRSVVSRRTLLRQPVYGLQCVSRKRMDIRGYRGYSFEKSTVDLGYGLYFVDFGDGLSLLFRGGVHLKRNSRTSKVRSWSGGGS